MSIEEFHRAYYQAGLEAALRDGATWTDTYWLGTQVLKTPFDLWMYQELIWRTRPDVIIETGTWNGGSAHYLASIFDLLGSGVVVTIDIESSGDRPAHPRIDYRTGSSTDPAVLDDLPTGRTMVTLDSDHAAAHVRAELDLYAPLVTPGCYLVVEDTNINGHPVLEGWGAGPAEAIAEWLPDHPEFVPDARCEKFLMTFQPGGWLERR